MTDFNQALLSHQVGQKQYELSNHLGNVQATVTDLPVPQGEYVYEYNSPALAAAYDYYPFGMLMPGRYVSDTTQQCATVTQTKWVTTYIDSCYDVVTWGNLRQAVLIGNGHVSTHTGTIQIEAATVNDGFGFHMDALPLSEQELSIDIDDMSGTGIMQAAELVNGNWVSLGSASLTKGRITLRVLPTTSDISVRVLGPVIMQVRRVCIKVPGLSQESMLVDICDGDGDRYRFGFNGQEKVNEWSGVGNFMEFSERGYDSRVGRFLKVDPIAHEYPWNSPYAFAENRVIDGIDLEGAEFYKPISIDIYAMRRVAVFAGDVAKGAGKVVLSGIGFVTELAGQAHYSDRMTAQNRAKHFTQTNGKNIAELTTEVLTAPLFAIRDVYDDPTNGEKWGALAVTLYGAKSSWQGIKTRGSVIQAKSYAYARAESIISNTTKSKMPRAVTAAVDIRTGKVYYGKSGGLKGKEINSRLQEMAPQESKTAWKDPLNCAECDAMNNALNDGAAPSDLILHTVEISKTKGTVKDMQRCDNCVETTKTTQGTTSD